MKEGNTYVCDNCSVGVIRIDYSEVKIGAKTRLIQNNRGDNLVTNEMFYLDRVSFLIVTINKYLLWSLIVSVPRCYWTMIFF